MEKSVGNSSTFFANASGDGVFNYGASAYATVPYIASNISQGGATAIWKITKVSPVNPGALGVVIKCQTKARTEAGFNIPYFEQPQTPTTYTWDFWATLQGLYDVNRSSILNGRYTSPGPSFGQGTSSATLSQTADGYELMPDLIIQLDTSFWTRVGTTNTWEAEIRKPVLVYAETRAFYTGPGFRSGVSAGGDTKMKLTFPAYPNAGGTGSTEGGGTPGGPGTPAGLG